MSSHTIVTRQSFFLKTSHRHSSPSDLLSPLFQLGRLTDSPLPANEKTILLTMPSSPAMDLPTEVLVIIIRFPFDELVIGHRQSSIYNFSPVCRQWYLVAIAYLYHTPFLDQNCQFAQLFNTVCHLDVGDAPRLGSMVKELDMGALHLKDLVIEWGTCCGTCQRLSCSQPL